MLLKDRTRERVMYDFTGRVRADTGGGTLMPAPTCPTYQVVLLSVNY